MRSRSRGSGPVRIGPDARRVLEAVAAGRVRRDDCDGAHPGMWARHVLEDGEEVGMTLRRLARDGLVDVPLLGPAQITPDGRRFMFGRP